MGPSDDTEAKNQPQNQPQIQINQALGQLSNGSLVVDSTTIDNQSALNKKISPTLQYPTPPINQTEQSYFNKTTPPPPSVANAQLSQEDLQHIQEKPEITSGQQASHKSRVVGLYIVVGLLLVGIVVGVVWLVTLII